MGELSGVVDGAICINFSNDVSLWWSLPYSLNSWLGGGNHEANRCIGLVSYFLIFLHEWDVELGVLCHFDPVLRVIEPTIIRLELDVFGLFFELFRLEEGSFVSQNVDRAFASISFSLPLAFNWIHIPCLGENLPNDNMIKLLKEICKIHPPWSIYFFSFGHIFKLLFYCLIFLPIICFLAEWASPNTLTSPWISDPN